MGTNLASEILNSVCLSGTKGDDVLLVHWNMEDTSFSDLIKSYLQNYGFSVYDSYTTQTLSEVKQFHLKDSTMYFKHIVYVKNDIAYYEEV